MKCNTLVLGALTATFAVLFLISPAAALFEHTWVAAGGSDSNDCSRLSPCHSFFAAYNKTEAGGVIGCADHGNFADLVFTITHSLTIDCETSANVVNEVGSGQITVSAAVGDVVTLRGINIDGTINVSNRLLFNGAGVLNLEKVNVRNNRGTGIQFFPTGAAKLYIVDSNILNNGSSGTVAGITIKPASGVTAAVSIERTRIENNFFGIIADGTGGGSIHGVVRDSNISGNANNGVTVSTTSTNVVLSIEGCTISGNNFGLAASGAGAGMLVGRSVITGNNTGLFTGSGAVLLSYRDNKLNANTSDGAFSGAVGLQ